MRKSIWVTWEKQRRTMELSSALGVKLYMILSERMALVRYISVSLKTISILLKERPECLIIQNPSIVLAVLAGFLKLIFKYRLVVDRHSNFLLGKTQYNLLDRLFFLMSDFSIKMADLTIVTNENLKKYVELKGGKGFVLPDKLPTPRVALTHSQQRNNVVTFICTYASDEPYMEVIKAASVMDKKIKVHITGNDKKINPQVFQKLPDNVVITGFIPDKEYDELLQKSDIIMDFTKLENCMVCGAYEAVAMGKPLVTSSTDVLKEYFTQGTLHIDHSPQAICDAIMKVYDNYDEFCEGIKQLKNDIDINWSVKFNELKIFLNDGE